MDRGVIAGCLISLAGCGGTLVPAPAAAPAPAPRRVVVPGDAVVVEEAAPPDLDLRCEDDRRCPAGIGMLVTPFPDELERCTAALVSSDRMVTAAHCLPPDARRAGASCHGSWVRFA